jgi:hypothetical protein
MRRTLRFVAIAIAVAGFVDPAVARRVRAPLSVTVQMPPESDPDFARAETLRADVLSALEKRVLVNGGAPPDAIAAIGDVLPGDSSVPVFAMQVAEGRPSIAIVEVAVPSWTVPGQAATVTATVRARGFAGRTSSMTLELRGSAIATVDHEWTKDDESFQTHFSFAPPGAGVHRVRVSVRTGSEEPAVADAVVVAREQPLRVLAFEPRPSWPVAFVRRSLEADALFDLAVTSRSSRAAATTSGSAPPSLASLDVDRYDALLVGALDELHEADLRVLDTFVAERGGTLILLPDRRVPESIRRRFDLPSTEEALVETPVRVQTSAGFVRASELLVAPAHNEAFEALASVSHGGSTRPVILAVNRGAGRVVLSGLLDAWRYRADEPGGFDMLWRGLAADAAMVAPRRIALTLTPMIARPGDLVTVSVNLRGTQFEDSGSPAEFPPVAASLDAADGRREMIRLWPGPRAGAYEARFVTPPPGRYSVSASAGNTSTDVPLLVGDDVVHPARDRSAELRHAAEASGGAVIANTEELRVAVAKLDTKLIEHTSRPMRSPWWIAPFSLLLCAEWALRRRAGLK